MAIFTVIDNMRAWQCVFFLDVNGIFEKRIIRTFGKCTSSRQLSRSISIARDERRTRNGSTEPGESAAGEAEISLINEAVTAVWNECRSRRERQTTIT